MKGLGLIYQLQQIELDAVELDSTEWDDLVKSLPSGDMMLLRDIKAALRGEPFHYFEGFNSKRKRLEAVRREEWSYYFSVFHNSEEYGLPSGGGWLDELPWTIHFLTQMRHVKRLIELDARAEAAKGTGTAGTISPATFNR